MRNIYIGDFKSKSGSWGLYKKLGKISISENNESFCIQGVVLNFYLQIMKNTPEGEKIKDLSDEELPLFLDTLVFRKGSVEELKEAIQELVDKAYKKGKEKRSQEFRDLLEI
jgi:hypothetical protein